MTVNPEQYKRPIGPESLSSVFGIVLSGGPILNDQQQRAAYRRLMGRDVPEPLAYPEWTLKPKDWLKLHGLDKAKRVPVSRKAPERKAELSPLENPGKVGAAAGLTRQRVYQIAS